MVSKSPKDRVVPLTNGLFMAYTWGWSSLLTSWDDPPSGCLGPKSQHLKSLVGTGDPKEPDANFFGRSNRWFLVGHEIFTTVVFFEINPKSRHELFRIMEPSPKTRDFFHGFLGLNLWCLRLNLWCLRLNPWCCCWSNPFSRGTPTPLRAWRGAKAWKGVPWSDLERFVARFRVDQHIVVLNEFIPTTPGSFWQFYQNPIEKANVFQSHHFSEAMLNFGGVVESFLTQRNSSFTSS